MADVDAGCTRSGRAPRNLPHVSLFWRLFLGTVVTLLVFVLVLAYTPITVSTRASTGEMIVLLAGLSVVYVINAVIIRRTLAPLARLRQALTDLDSPRPDLTVPVRGADEVAAVATAYNLMLDRLDRERENTMRSSLSAQEEERARVSGELHDQVGQSLTVLLLRLQMLGRAVPPEFAGQVEDLRDGLRQTLEDVRDISARLRPGLLAELGLGPALHALVADLTAHTGLDIRLSMPSGWPRGDSSPEQDLVIYRVTQEALTNVVRHADATAASVEITETRDSTDSTGPTGLPGGLSLTIRDNGRGIAGDPGTGITGMTERARLVRGRLTIDSEPGVGTTVVLDIPASTRREDRT